MKKKLKIDSELMQFHEKSFRPVHPGSIEKHGMTDDDSRTKFAGTPMPDSLIKGKLKGKSESKYQSRGSEGFEARYSALFGNRWGSIKQAFSMQTDMVGLVINSAGSYNLVENGSGSILEIESGGGIPAEVHYSEPENQKAYWLDRVSVFAAESLFLKEYSRVLDACAAPGGKTLVLAARLPTGARLVANELSPDRRSRLSRVISEHLPASIATKVRITGRDAATLCKDMKEKYDAILLDVPCSSERHVYGNASALKEWGPGRVKNLTYRQWALLSSAWRMLEPGGCLIYCTCSISPEENEDILDKLERKYSEDIFWDVPQHPDAEPRGKGIIFLPDRTHGAGPLFVGRLVKKISAVSG